MDIRYLQIAVRYKTCCWTSLKEAVGTQWNLLQRIFFSFYFLILVIKADPYYMWSLCILPTKLAYYSFYFSGNQNFSSVIKFKMYGYYDSVKEQKMELLFTFFSKCGDIFCLCLQTDSLAYLLLFWVSFLKSSTFI